MKKPKITTKHSYLLLGIIIVYYQVKKNMGFVIMNINYNKKK